jgi:sterol-4alpha-carboxylate 3-dehydrogenase (decarboxylating)
MAKENLNNVLVTGGSSFIGYHILSPRPRKHTLHAKYLSSISLPLSDGSLQFSTTTWTSVTSRPSTSAIKDWSSPVINATEELPVLLAQEQKFPYPLSKALAEQAVLSANRKYGMAIISLRPASCFGEVNEEMIEELIGVARSGEGISRWEMELICSILCMPTWRKGFPSSCESTTGRGAKSRWGSIPPHELRAFAFWDFTREVAKQAWYEVKKGDIRIVTRWVEILMAFLAEWSVWIVSGGRKEPVLTRYGVRYRCFTRTVSCEKAKRRLGYRSAIGMQGGIERSVKWFLESKKDY